MTAVKLAFVLFLCPLVYNLGAANAMVHPSLLCTCRPLCLHCAQQVTHLPERAVFYTSVLPLLAYYALFATVIYPLAGSLHPMDLMNSLMGSVPTGKGCPGRKGGDGVDGGCMHCRMRAGPVLEACESCIALLCEQLLRPMDLMNSLMGSVRTGDVGPGRKNEEGVKGSFQRLHLCPSYVLGPVFEMSELRSDA